MGRIKNWYYTRNKAVRIMIQITAIIALIVVMEVFVAPLCYEAGRALGQWSRGLSG